MFAASAVFVCASDSGSPIVISSMAHVVLYTFCIICVYKYHIHLNVSAGVVYSSLVYRLLPQTVLLDIVFGVCVINVCAQHTQVYFRCLEIQFKSLETASQCSVDLQKNSNDNVYSDYSGLFNHAVNRLAFRAIFVLYGVARTSILKYSFQIRGRNYCFLWFYRIFFRASNGFFSSIWISKN